MKKSPCELLLQYYPKISEVDHLRSTFIANCVLNVFLSSTAILFNSVTLLALRKTSSLPKTLRTLLVSLAVSDICVGLLGQTLYTSLLVKWLQLKIINCSIYMAFDVLMGLFAIASFVGVVAVGVDRFLAIHLHLRYHELVTYKRVVAVVISIWLLSTSLPFIVMLGFTIFSLVISIFGVVNFVLALAIYTKMYSAVRRHKTQIQALRVGQVGRIGETANFAGVVKSAVGTFYVYLVLLVCYVPHLVCLAAIEFNGTSIALKGFFLFSLTLAFFNSSLNPVIYCWRLRHIRQAIMDILRDMCGKGNHPRPFAIRRSYSRANDDCLSACVSASQPASPSVSQSASQSTF